MFLVSIYLEFARGVGGVGSLRLLAYYHAQFVSVGH